MGSKIPALSGLYKYSALTKNSSEYARRMRRLSNGIFGELVKESPPKVHFAMKRLSRLPDDLNKEITHYYPRHVETGWIMLHLRDYGLFRDEHKDFQEQMEAQRELRGKGKRNKKTRGEIPKDKKKNIL